MKHIQEIWDSLKTVHPGKVALACAADRPVLEAARRAHEQGIADFILIDDTVKLRALAADMDLNLTDYELIHEPDPATAARLAAGMVHDGEAEVVMKGLLESAVFLKACLDREHGLRKPDSMISAIAVIESPKYEKLMFLTDLAFTPVPDLEAKKKILQNAVAVAQRFGVETPKVACLAPAEKVNPKIPATQDAADLAAAAATGQLGNCLVAGPISMDLAVSREAAIHKWYANPVAGDADILLAPDITVGNVLYKTLSCLSDIRTGGVMAGAAAPIVFCSRSDSAETKVNTIAFAMYLSQFERGAGAPVQP